MAIYFFGLSVKICDDHIAFSDNCEVTSCAHLENGQTDNHIADECSPFCMCSCCGTITIFYAIKYTFERDFTALPKTSYSENFFSVTSSSIWQPPKI